MHAQTFSTAKRLARTVLPTAITSRWSRWRISAMVRRSEDENRRRAASDVFDDIYKENKWGEILEHHFQEAVLLGLRRQTI
jgi:hypothetical protein